ncbi:uncharacterized protein LOC128664308 [Bombina bombina]|uniref:uncharacterized protein LOC128664308 n=1 Tax=Bombina bombina TaxID=8345 RepID=UPI00235A6A94|nr:uncharacterized protein LOC128664308 [Bombina bombina]
MYTDDILFVMTKVETTLPDILTKLSNYGKVSNFHLNITKLELLNITSPSSVVSQLETTLHISIDRKKMKYLGINLTSNDNDLLQFNFQTLKTEITRDLQSWFTAEATSIQDTHKGGCAYLLMGVYQTIDKFKGCKTCDKEEKKRILYVLFEQLNPILDILGVELRKSKADILSELLNVPLSLAEGLLSGLLSGNVFVIIERHLDVLIGTLDHLVISLTKTVKSLIGDIDNILTDLSKVLKCSLPIVGPLIAGVLPLLGGALGVVGAVVDTALNVVGGVVNGLLGGNGGLLSGLLGGSGGLLGGSGGLLGGGLLNGVLGAAGAGRR